jgi:hypothetical protein
MTTSDRIRSLAGDGLFSLAALKAQRAHWQEMKGKRTNAFLKDAGKKAAATRAANAEAKLRS